MNISTDRIAYSSTCLQNVLPLLCKASFAGKPEIRPNDSCSTRPGDATYLQISVNAYSKSDRDKFTRLYRKAHVKSVHHIFFARPGATTK